MKLPRELGPIHFVGIGGIGMSGIAEVLNTLGYRVQGSDVSEGANVLRLRAKGIPVFVGHHAENLGEAEVVVVSTAIRRDNPELAVARERRLPVVRRAEMLAELMRLKACVAIAGTHGKTTTTSLVATLLDAGGFDPTVINGGIINAYGTNARLGEGDWMVVEADESDGTFLKLPADVAVITNIDAEHLDHFKTFDAIKDAFRTLVENLPFYGFAVMCLDHPTVQELVGRIEDRRVVTYGENPQADVRLLDVDLSGGMSRFNVLIRDRKTSAATYIEDVVMPMPGHHNALNATAAIAVAVELKVPVEAIREALARLRRRQAAVHPHGGVERRRHLRRLRPSSGGDRGRAQGGPRLDQKPGHRRGPAASLLAAAILFNDFATCFNDADAVVVADVYAAGEAPIEGVDRDHLVAAIKAHGHRQVVPLESPSALAGIVRQLAGDGDYILCLGAGNITQWAYALPGELAAGDAR